MSDDDKKSDVNPDEPHTFVEVPGTFPEKCSVCGGFKGDMFRPDMATDGFPVHPD